jgi:hypothetical protein
MRSRPSSNAIVETSSKTTITTGSRELTSAVSAEPEAKARSAHRREEEEVRQEDRRGGREHGHEGAQSTQARVADHGRQRERRGSGHQHRAARARGIVVEGLDRDQGHEQRHEEQMQHGPQPPAREPG